MREGGWVSYLLHVIILAWFYENTYAAASPVRVYPNATLQQRLRAANILLDEAPLIDGHNDLAKNLRQYLHNKLGSFNFSSILREKSMWNSSILVRTDLPRLRAGKVAAQLWSAMVPCESQYLNGVQLLMEQVDVIRRVIFSHKDLMTHAKTSQDIMHAFEKKILASVITVEGGHAIGSSMGVIRSLYDLGVRSIALTHRCHTPWAECSEKTNDMPNSRGLTPFGKEIVAELNRLGILIDLSHSSSNTARDVLSHTRAPVIFSHSATKILCNAAANIPDDIISALAINGGIIMISFQSDHLTCGKNTSISDIIAQINHVRTMAGVDHVGLGAGFEGFNRAPKNFQDVSFYPDLFAELLRDSAWSVQDLKKLAGLNFLRVFSKVEDIREDMSEIPPSEEIIPIHDIDSKWPCRYKFANLDVNRRS